MAGQKPQDIAREAVKLLTARKLVPTPDNYQAAYHEVAGTRPLRPFPLEYLRQLVNALPTQTPGQIRFQQQLARAVERHSWDDLIKAIAQHAKLSLAAPSGPVNAPARVETESTFPPELREQMARIVNHALPAVGNDDAKIVEQAQTLVDYLRLDSQHPPTLRRMMGDFAFRLSFVAEEQAVIRNGLQDLLRQVFDHIRDLSPENPWLKEQMQALLQAVEPPLSARRLDELNSRLKDVIHKQVENKARSQQAQQAMKDTLGTFIQRLGEMTDHSAHYQQKMEGYARELDNATHLDDIAPLLQEAVQSTRAMAVDSQRVSDELQSLRNRAQQAESEVARLQAELDQLSALACHDLLTGVLNRKGLQEIAIKELARAERMGGQVCLAMLDIDDFKHINDQHGHDTGDAALRHLAEVARSALRAHDSVARYGGEEFVIVMPDTQIEEAEQIVTRLQRQLTIEYFMQGDQKLLITFSAGVTQIDPAETPADALKRADQAMYLAKRSGKNRVVRG